ncbi:retropepsin-like aspartic protease family protein [Acetobacter sacchari]|nr:retropepsin-like aspartic protease [Acetobacter sacchari]
MSGVSSSVRAFDVAYTGATTLGSGIGGMSRFPVMSIAELGMGTATARNVQMIQTDQKFGSIGGVPIVGLFGADFLSNYTVALELPHLTVNLYRLHECTDEKERWEKEFDPVPFTIDNDRHVEISMKINGAPVDAILDSGAAGTTILPEDAARAGVTKSMLAADRAVSLIGVDQNAVHGWRHKFQTLQVGKEIFSNPTFMIAPMEVSTALLGADFLRHNSVMISYRYRRVYIRNDDIPVDGTPPK